MLRRVRAWLARRIVARLRRVPLHVAIIPDGNRRWARRRGLPAWAGHIAGYNVMKRVLNFLWDVGVKYVTIYALSRENCTRRPRAELVQLYSLLSKAVDELASDERIASGKVDARFVGDFSLVPPSLREKLLEFNERYWRGNGSKLNVCVCYSGRWEILEAASRVNGRVTENEFTKLLPLGDVPPPDLLIRTGGEYRISNFLLWHISYTELYFTRKLWPDIDELDVALALLDYSRRERRFGA